jgi:hypothetical protein
LKLFRKWEQRGLLERASEDGRATLSLPEAVGRQPAEQAAPPPAAAEAPPPPAPRPEREGPSPRWDRRILLGGLVVAVLVGAVVVTVILADGDDSPPQGPAGQDRPRERSAAPDGTKDAETESQPSPSAVALTGAKRASTAVLSGSAEPGIATRTGEELKKQGFKVAAVGNAAGPSTQSVVLYATASRRAEARALARSLGIKATKPLDTLNAERALGAQLVVLVGADREGKPADAEQAR